MENILNFKNIILDDIYVNSPVGSRHAALSNNLRGFNIATEGVATVPPNTDRQGYVFFTRPQLNLTARNCSRHRLMYNLLTYNESSLQTWVRATLDPRLYSISSEFARSPMVQNTNPFIPLLTNSIRSLSGAPDLIVPIYTSQEGVRKEVHSMVDGPMEYNQEFDLDATFANTQDDPISQLFYTWEQYATLVSSDSLNPYMDMLVENEIDYNTRIYRIVVDKTGKYVSKIAACGAAIPRSLPTGEFANYNRETPVNTSQKDIPIRFNCNGAIYNDPRLMTDFNEVVKIFNPRFRSFVEGNYSFDSEAKLKRLSNKDSDFFKVNDLDLNRYNYITFPYIDIFTNELMWIVDKNEANNRISTLDLENDSKLTIGDDFIKEKLKKKAKATIGDDFVQNKLDRAKRFLNRR